MKEPIYPFIAGFIHAASKSRPNAPNGLNYRNGTKANYIP